MIHSRPRLNGARASKLSLALALTVLAGGASSAQAVFPDFTGCVRSTPNINGCFNVQSRSGFLDIKGFSVPIGESFQIRGALASSGPGSTQIFVPATGTTGIISKPIQVPGGLLGINFPIPGNKVTATAELASTNPSAAIRVDGDTLTVAMPLKLRLSNPLIGPNCHIGSNSSPVNVRLILGTTSPPPPNRPISGRLGAVSFETWGVLYRGNTNVDNSFSIPGASSCGLGLGLIDQIVNAKMRLPSAAGNNTMVVTNDVALGGLS
jgi:hypothetical protein